MRKKLITSRLAFSGFCICLVTMASGVWAQDSNALLQEKLNAMRTMQASFKQIVRADQREISRSKGSMALERPGKFRWQTQSPMEQLVIADGSKIWIYDKCKSVKIV